MQRTQSIVGTSADIFGRLPELKLVAALDTMGTLSMLPKDKGGVVDPNLKACYD